MTEAPFVSASAMAGSLAYTIIKDIGGTIAFEQAAGETVSAVPITLKDEVVTHRGWYTVGGVWYTHTRIYPLIRFLRGDRPDHEKFASADLLNKAQTVGVQFPFKMCFQVVSVNNDQYIEKLSGLLKTQKERYKASRSEIDDKIKTLQDDIARNARKLAGGPSRGGVGAVNDKIRRALLREGEDLQAELKRMMQERRGKLKGIRARIKGYEAEVAAQIGRADNERLYIKGFQISVADNWQGVKRYQSAGIKVNAKMDVSILENQDLSTTIRIRLQWYEAALAYAKDWHGHIDISLVNGMPEVTGSGKFYDRFKRYQAIENRR
ncbi:hypothetical protein [Streptomyces chartreusis]|uniref:hypothetical protein n=1 Tax=Streptomyces chartreusis TaxID=1969 RepID=UPI0033E0E673